MLSPWLFNVFGLSGDARVLVKGLELLRRITSCYLFMMIQY